VTALRVGAGPLRLRVERRTLAVGAVLVGVLAAAALASLMSGTVSLSPGQVLGALGGHADSERTARVMWQIRVPRVVTALAVGMALGAAGCVFQSVSRNALGSPDVIGFTSGAATGAVVQIVLIGAGPGATIAAAVAAGLLTALVVYALARKDGVSGGYRLVLVGIGVSAFAGALNTLVLARGDIDLTTRARVWLSGSLNARTWDDAWPPLAAVAVLVPALAALARHLDILEMGDDQAGQLGVHAERTRLLAMLIGVVLTAAAVAGAGPIAFVALAAPQIAVRLTRASRVQVIVSALMGAGLLLLADLVSVHLPVRAALPVGLTTGALGGVYLLWVLSRSRSV
jgi:iron complex transport system permease protein